jgi:hypothetical protein
MLSWRASGRLEKSTCTEWSTTRSTGTRGSMMRGFLSKRAAAERMAARSTRSGTPVKSCRRTRATMKGISSSRSALQAQLARVRTSRSVILRPSTLRRTDSRTMRMETGSLETGPTPAASSFGSE